MHILHVITGLGDGGAEAVLYRLITFENGGIRHVVVSLSDSGKYGAMLESKGVRVYCLGMPRGGLTLRSLVQLWSILKQESPQVIQTWMYHANLVGGVVARLAGFANIVWGIHHTNLVPGTTGRSTRTVDWLCARLSRWVPRRIVACAQKSMEAHVEKRYDSKKFSVVPNGYDVTQFTSNAAAGEDVRLELGLLKGERIVGLVGRWDPQKDHANLIAAIASLRCDHPALQLVLAGNDCDLGNAALVQLLREAGLHAGVHLLGRRSDVPALMNALDLHVLSSYGEAFPNVVAEAMACGTPCVVTDVGDASMIVGNTGWVVPPKNPSALAKAIDEALLEIGDKPRWAARKAHARARIVAKFSLEAMVASYRDVWSAK